MTRRAVVHAYKDEHWHTYWQALFECGHWGLAPNRMLRTASGTPYRGHAARAICDRCRKGEPFQPGAAAEYMATHKLDDSRPMVLPDGEPTNGH